MGHGRIKMEFIENDSTRMLTYQKRKKNLLKKVSEFSILCGVEACLIIFGPRYKGQPVMKLDAVWPSNSNEAKSIIDRYKKTDQAKRCYYASHYFSGKKRKVDAEISRLQKQAFDAKHLSCDAHLASFPEDQLRVLLTRLESKLQVVDKKLNSFKENQMDVFVPQMAHELVENYITRSSNLQAFPDMMKPLDVKFPICVPPEQNLYMFPSNSSFMGTHNSSVCSTNLQPFSDSHSTVAGRNLDLNNSSSSSDSSNLQLQLFSPGPLDVQLPMHFQSLGMSSNPNLTEDVTRNHNFSNQFGGKGIINNNIPSLPGLSYVYPHFLMPDNVIVNDLDASLPLQTMFLRSQLQHPNQVQPSQVNKFSHNIISK